jgi:hypothetical protein
VFVFDFGAPLRGPHGPIAPIQFNILFLGLHCFVIHVQLGVPFSNFHHHVVCVWPWFSLSYYLCLALIILLLEFCPNVHFSNLPCLVARVQPTSSLS